MVIRSICLFLCSFSFQVLWPSLGEGASYFDRNIEKRHLFRACMSDNSSFVTNYFKSFPMRNFLLRERYGDQRQTLLHIAIFKEKTAVVRALLQLETPLEIYDKKGWTPLHYASFVDNPYIAVLLLSAGASLAVYDHKGCSPYGIAVLGEKKQIKNFYEKERPHYGLIPELPLIEKTHYRRWVQDEDGFLDFSGWIKVEMIPNRC